MFFVGGAKGFVVDGLHLSWWAGEGNGLSGIHLRGKRDSGRSESKKEKNQKELSEFFSNFYFFLFLCK